MEQVHAIVPLVNSNGIRMFCIRDSNENFLLKMGLQKRHV